MQLRLLLLVLGIGRNRHEGFGRIRLACHQLCFQEPNLQFMSIIRAKLQLNLPPVLQCEYMPLRQYSQVAHEQIQEIRTRSPFLNPLTESPNSSTIPTPSWPRILPGVQVATSPLAICKSRILVISNCFIMRVNFGIVPVPQMVDLVSLIIASVGCVILGLGRSSSLTSPTALYTSAFIVEYDACRIGGRKI